ncbi:MAG: HD domain-containing protein [Bdellovibrionota bacterium]|nr:MAG: HD domain-containing protein [Bdellovibrionota bacterium]
MLPDDLIRKVEFLKEIEKLKLVNRANKTLGGKRFENSAEHSWHIALMAIVLRDYYDGELDLLRVVKMLLIHDLVEIDAGDTWLYASDTSSKFEAEHNGAVRLFGMLPRDHEREFLSLWREFEDRETPEAQFASSIDGIQPLLNHLVTGDPADGVLPLERVKAKKEYIKTHAPRLWSLVEELIQSSAEMGLYR